MFHGVSALARIYINGALVAEHLGIWDAFSVRVEEAGSVHLRVEVIKNGGATIPVSMMASGFLPFVFNTFGGIYKPVEFVEQEADPVQYLPAANRSVKFDSHQLFVDNEPVFLRGILHWGWYPELLHPSPDTQRCNQEIQAIKQMGFNCVKFCLWAPPHHYLEILEREGLFAWMEMPIWNPGQNIAQFKTELGQIVKQYRHHRSIILWTIGCELGHQMSSESRKELFDCVKDWTGGALVKDSSGGAEMYGGDPREFGDFEDFHPYCDLCDFPEVLDLLQPGARRNKAAILGETNDFDSHRDLPRIAREAPCWASANPELNDKGVRWQYDLPTVITNSRFVTDETANSKLLKQSREMKLFVHRTFQEWIRYREFSGCVVTGMSDTPISTSGFFDDWGNPKFEPEKVRRFMAQTLFFLIPQRRLRWMDGGNKSERWDAWHVFEGWNRIRVGVHSEVGYQGEVKWSIANQAGTARVCVDPLTATEIVDIAWFAEPDTSYELQVECPAASQSWKITSVANLSENICAISEANDITRAPAFREAAYEFRHPVLENLFSGKPQTLYMALGNAFLRQVAKPLMLRIDTRTYEELPVAGLDNDGSLVHSFRVGIDPVGVLVQRCLGAISTE